MPTTALLLDVGGLPNHAVVATRSPLRTPLIEVRGRAASRREGWACFIRRPRVRPWFRGPTVTPALRALVEAEVLATHGGAVIVVGLTGSDRDGEIDGRGLSPVGASRLSRRCGGESLRQRRRKIDEAAFPGVSVEGKSIASALDRRCWATQRRCSASKV